MAYKDKKDQANTSHTHYLKNKEKVKARARVFTKHAIKRNKEYVNEYLKSHPCLDCGESDVIVLEFDHVRGTKANNVANMVSNGCSLVTIQKEIDKCEVRCSNCHRRMTHKRRNKNVESLASAV